MRSIDDHIASVADAPQFSNMQLIKRRFFAMRNGAVADSLRKQGAPYKLIFGLNLPQLVDIAHEYAPNNELAMLLKSNDSTRESLLIAPMLYDKDSVTVDLAVEWLSTAPTTEVVDVACLKLFKHTTCACDIVDVLCERDDVMSRYAALRLSANLLPLSIDRAERIARIELERHHPMTLTAAALLLDDIAWRRDNA